MRRTRDVERILCRIRSAACCSATHPRCLSTGAVAHSANAPQQGQHQPPSSNRRSWWALAVSTAAAAAAFVPHPAHTGSENLEPEALRELAADLGAKYGTTDRERAASMLSSLTIFLEHHQALLDAGIFPALMAAVLDASAVPQVRVIALSCAADLLKDPRAKRAAAAEEELIPMLLSALQGEGEWGNGPEEGGLARSQAARALAELAAEPGLHPLLVRSSAAAALADHGAQLAAESDEEDKTYASLAEVPGNMVERHAVEGERFTAAALYGLAGSDAGTKGLLATGEGSSGAATLRGLGRWAASNDPVLQRYGVGALARVAASGPAGFNAVADAGVLPHLIAALACGDAQVRCFAAGAIGHVAAAGGPPVAALLKAQAVPRLLAMLQPQPIAASVIGGDSPGVRRGVYRCALRAMLRGMQNPDFKRALQEAGAVVAIKAFLESGEAGDDQQLGSLAEAVIAALQ